MEKITLNEYLKQGSVVENLKNFVGVTPENTVGLMTPERLAAVAGALVMKNGQELTSFNDLEVCTVYTLPSLINITEGCPELNEKGLMATIITVSYSTGSKHQILISGRNIATREFYAKQWRNWQF